jgi:transposase InsO family protein
LDALDRKTFLPKPINSDNGSEFINYHLARRCQQRGIQFTRGRPYKKDDNAHVEQKNWTHIRKLFGWNCYETQGAVDLMNNLYKNEWHLFMNLFMPSTKLVQKTRIGSKHKRQHDLPATPLDRLINLGKGDQRKIANYKKIREQTDPFELSKSIEEKIQAVYNMAADRHRKNTTNKSKQKYRLKPKPGNTEQEALKEVAKIFGIKVKYRGKNLAPQG